MEHCPGGELLQTNLRLQGLRGDLPGAGGRRDSPPSPHARVPRQVPGHQAGAGAEDHAARGVASVAARESMKEHQGCWTLQQTLHLRLCVYRHANSPTHAPHTLV